MDRKDERTSRREMLLIGAGAFASASLPAALAWAGPFDSLALDRRARVLRQGPVVVPAASGAGPGVAGADIVAPRRGFLGIDWVIAGKIDVTLMLLTARQKMQLSGGGRPSGEPLMRFDIAGPETAGQNAQVSQGNYYLAWLNRAQRPVQLLYRASFLPF
jgi:hypothetical protein